MAFAVGMTFAIDVKKGVSIPKELVKGNLLYGTGLS